MSRLPLLVRLPSPLACRADRWRARLGRIAKSVRSDRTLLTSRFDFHCDERRFASAMLERFTHLWLFRADQRRRCGDFVVVDMSSPSPKRRGVFVLDLKLGAPLVERAGVQMLNVPLALQELSASGTALVPEATTLRGDGAKLLHHWN